MSNFKTTNTPVFDYKICTEDYWDFHLALDSFSKIPAEGMSERCLAAYINIADESCIDGENLVSKGWYSWEGAFNDGVTFSNIGLTGVDNGLIHYDKDRITNSEFLNMFFNSEKDFEANDYRLHLNKVYGNNKIYSYDAEIVGGAVRLNGGFYQGFFKDADTRYQVLPHIIENGWQIEVTLKKEDFERENVTMRLIDHYPENKGIFFFIGARAENKWWKYYKTDKEFDRSETNYLELDILPIELPKPETMTPYLNLDYIGTNYDPKQDLFNVGDLLDLGFKIYSYKEELDPNNPLKHFVSQDTPINKDMVISTKGGFSVMENDEVFIDTDNKFLLFDRTESGYTTCTWGEKEENTKFTIQMEKKPTTENYFTLFDRTESGYTTCTIDSYLSTFKNSYNVDNDVYRNALAFMVDDEGKIGYRYTVKDCDADSPKIEAEFSKYPLIKDGEWHTISIRILPNETQEITKYDYPNLLNYKSRTMKFLFYVDGYLKFVTKDLPILDLRPLNTMPEKQEGVPFNISLGGGTQGLCDCVDLDYKTPPKEVLFMEKNYGGSFIGWIKDFKFYSCPQDLFEVRKNLTAK